MLVRTLQNKRSLLTTFARLAISVMLIALLVWWLGGFGKIGAIMSRISFRFVMLVLIICTLDRALMTFKWIRLLEARGIRFRFLAAMRIYCASMIWGLFLPSTVGADVIRTINMSRAGVDSHEVIASIIIERTIGFLAVLLLGIASLLLFSMSGSFENHFTVAWWIALIMIVSAMAALMASFSDRAFNLIHDRVLGRFRNNRIAIKFRKFHETYRTYRSNPRSLVSFSALTLAEQLLVIVQSWLVAWTIGVHVGIVCFAVAVPLSILVARIPIGIGGIGTFDAAFAFLLSLAGISAAEAVAIPFTGRILQILASLPWWLAHMILTRRVRSGAGKAYPEPAAT